MAGCAVSAACRITTCHTGMCSWAQVQPKFSLHAQQTMHTHVALRGAAGARAAYMRGRRDCAQASADRDVRVQHRRGPHQNRELINSADSRMLDRSSPYLTHQRIECKTRTQEENYGGSIFLNPSSNPCQKPRLAHLRAQSRVISVNRKTPARYSQDFTIVFSIRIVRSTVIVIPRDRNQS